MVYICADSILMLVDNTYVYVYICNSCNMAVRDLPDVYT